MGHFVPHSEADIERMLADVGLGSLDELFDVIPEALRLAGGLRLPDGLSEPDVAVEMDRLASKNRFGERPTGDRRGRATWPRPSWPAINGVRTVAPAARWDGRLL